MILKNYKGEMYEESQKQINTFLMLLVFNEIQL